MAGPYAKELRILDLYERLCAGAVLDKEQEAERFGVHGRSIQRDLDDIRAFLAEKAVSDPGERRQIVYDRRHRGYRMRGSLPSRMSNGEILAVSKILLESRAFPKAEMDALLDKLTAGCVPRDNLRLVSELLANEKLHYMELTRPDELPDKLWALGEAIQQRRRLRIAYMRQGDLGTVERVVEPAAILFSEYYFYLCAYIVERQDSGAWERRYDYPALFRVDRVMQYDLLEERFNQPYADRFQEGEFRKRVQFMYAGRLEKIRFRYTGSSVPAILDRLPTARILEQGEGGTVLEAEVYGRGVVMWLLSQGDRVEVLAPDHMRSAMRDALQAMLALYGTA